MERSSSANIYPSLERARQDKAILSGYSLVQFLAGHLFTRKFSVTLLLFAPVRNTRLSSNNR